MTRIETLFWGLLVLCFAGAMVNIFLKEFKDEEWREKLEIFGIAYEGLLIITTGVLIVASVYYQGYMKGIDENEKERKT